MREKGAAVNTDEASIAGPPLTSCCAAWFLTGHRPVLVCGPGFGDPCSGTSHQHPSYVPHQDQKVPIMALCWFYLPPFHHTPCPPLKVK